MTKVSIGCVILRGNGARAQGVCVGWRLHTHMQESKVASYRELVLLSVLTAADEKYGRQIREEYKQRTKEEMPLGSLYVTLDRMEDKGFIRGRMGESASERGGNRRKYYRITANGRTTLQRAQTAAFANFGGAGVNG